MPLSSSAPLRLLVRSAAGLALLLVCMGATPPQPAATTAAPTPSGQARVWFYRVFFPNDTGDMPAIAMNGQLVGYARAGVSFYRDVPAGPYHLTVASTGVDINQAKDVVLAPGEQLAVSIASDPNWMSDGRRDYRRGTYYVWFEPPQIAAIHLSQSSFGSGY
jgi:hypothetical protein